MGIVTCNHPCGAMWETQSVAQHSLFCLVLGPNLSFWRGPSRLITTVCASSGAQKLPLTYKGKWWALDVWVQFPRRQCTYLNPQCSSVVLWVQQRIMGPKIKPIKEMNRQIKCHGGLIFVFCYHFWPHSESLVEQQILWLFSFIMGYNSISCRVNSLS